MMAGLLVAAFVLNALIHPTKFGAEPSADDGTEATDDLMEENNDNNLLGGGDESHIQLDESLLGMDEAGIRVLNRMMDGRSSAWDARGVRVSGRKERGGGWDVRDIRVRGKGGGEAVAG